MKPVFYTLGILSVTMGSLRAEDRLELLRKTTVQAVQDHELITEVDPSYEVMNRLRFKPNTKVTVSREYGSIVLSPLVFKDKVRKTVLTCYPVANMDVLKAKVKNVDLLRNDESFDLNLDSMQDLSIQNIFQPARDYMMTSSAPLRRVGISFGAESLVRSVECDLHGDGIAGTGLLKSNREVTVGALRKIFDIGGNGILYRIQHKHVLGKSQKSQEDDFSRPDCDAEQHD